MNEDVKIWDETLEHVLVVGTFKGINKFGHARIMEPDGKIIEVMEGRMRRADDQSMKE